MAKQSFTQEQKAEALQLLSEGNTLKSVAQQVGCSVASLQNWQKTTKTTRKRKPKRMKSTAPCDCEEQYGCTKECNDEGRRTSHQMKNDNQRPSFEQIKRHFWEKRAVDVLLMDKEVSAEVLQYANEALEYMYDET